MTVDMDMLDAELKAGTPARKAALKAGCSVSMASKRKAALGLTSGKPRSRPAKGSDVAIATLLESDPTKLASELRTRAAALRREAYAAGHRADSLERVAQGLDPRDELEG